MEAVSKPDNTSVFSPIVTQDTTTSDITDAGSEGSRVHPQDSVEDYADAVPVTTDKLQEPQLKKKSLIRSLKKGTSKRIKQLAQGTKDLTESLRTGSFARAGSGRISVDDTSQEKTADSEEQVTVEDGAEQEHAAVKIQQAYRSFSDKKRVEEEQKQVAKEQGDAAVKIQAGVRGFLARKESLKLQEIAAKVQEEQSWVSEEVQSKESKKKRPIKRAVVVVGVVAALVFGIRKAL
eukprot:TRINITY_DN1545_c0_g1_i2.p3 TRINITY_DN1545_c0_g1~~TRINITY_DN1545_c0_g1_i2.p3  ORF type:complete len:235 (+),score=47.57 TRINITY_DN1545_c0_g1_i2:124-828(+)